jgi:hypothetical protein
MKFQPKAALVASAIAIGISVVGTAAQAEPTKKDDSYGYIFSDDALKAEGPGANTARITVIPMGRRDRLLRPRVHFVTEMLKSVEQM